MAQRDWSIAGGWADASVLALRPSAALAETIPRGVLRLFNITAAASGSLRLYAIPVRSGLVISSISFLSGTTAGATLTNTQFGLFDSSRNQLRATADDTTASWSASTIKTLSLTSTFTTTYTGLHYVGCKLVTSSGTIPTLYGQEQAAALTGLAPKLHIASNSGLTTTLGSTPAADNGAQAHIAYAYVS